MKTKIKEKIRFNYLRTKIKTIIKGIKIICMNKKVKEKLDLIIYITQN